MQAVYDSQAGHGRFDCASFSSRSLVYKGMLLSEQVQGYYQDLQALDVESAITLVHSRFCANPFPNWQRAHPYRYVIHNGEINTLQGNVNWMMACQAMFHSWLFGDDLPEVLCITNPTH